MDSVCPISKHSNITYQNNHWSIMEHELFDVVFGLDHIIAEFFWNAVFAVIVYGFTKARTLRKIHKYVDSKHGVEHEVY